MLVRVLFSNLLCSKCGGIKCAIFVCMGDLSITFLSIFKLYWYHVNEVKKTIITGSGSAVFDGSIKFSFFQKISCSLKILEKFTCNNILLLLHFVGLFPQCSTLAFLLQKFDLGKIDYETNCIKKTLRWPAVVRQIFLEGKMLSAKDE